MLNPVVQCECYKVSFLLKATSKVTSGEILFHIAFPQFIFRAPILYLIVQIRAGSDYIYPFQCRYSQGQMYCSIYSSNHLSQLIRRQNGNTSVWNLFLNTVSTDDYINCVQHEEVDIQYTHIESILLLEVRI